MDSLRAPRNITPMGGSCYKVIDSSIAQESFLCLEMLTMHYRINIRVEDNKKG